MDFTDEDIEAVAEAAYNKRCELLHEVVGNKEFDPWKTLGHRELPHGTVQRELASARAALEIFAARYPLMVKEPGESESSP
jgi:hypothetical protein